MLKIYNSPIYSVQDGTSSFLYNVCGGRQPVNFTLQSQQCQISAIDSDGLYARLRLNTNIIPYLQNLIAAGFAAQIYVVDNEAGLYDYTGGYIVSNMIEVNGVAFLTIKNSDNDNQTFFVNKIFGGNWDSQVIYKYNTVLSLQYIDITSINGNSANSLITTQKTALNLNGINTINISELCRGYIPQTGGKRIRVNITATDYFNNSETTITPDVLLVDTRNLDVNYDNFTMFNPVSRGQLLPSTGQKLIYSATDNTIYPFYINFVTNSSLGEYMPKFFFCIKAYKNNVLKATVNVNLIVVQGLNVINISNDNVIKKLILENEPDLISIKTVGYLYTVGDFSADFNGNDFVVSAVVSSLESDLSYISCTEKTLNDRKDFLLYFDNSIGGQSSILCNDFTRTIKPEITALRNRTNISNFVSRETEEVKLKFYGLSITDFEFLTGYNINSAKKRDGIFESQTIKRVTSAGDEQLYIIRAADYDADNSQLYTDLTLTIYRTIIQN